MAGNPKLTKAHIAYLVEKALRKKLSKASLEEAIPHTYGHKTRAQRIGRFLTKDLFAKDDAGHKKEKHLEAEQRVRALYSDIARTLGSMPPQLEDKITLLRDIKEKISRALIWGDVPLLDLIRETEDSDETEE